MFQVEERLVQSLLDKVGRGWAPRAATWIAARAPARPGAAALSTGILVWQRAGARSPSSAVRPAEWTDMGLRGVDSQRNLLKRAPAKGCSMTTGLPNLVGFSRGLPLHKNMLGGSLTESGAST